MTVPQLINDDEDSEIALETAEENQIPNFQGTEISSFHANQFGEFESKYGDDVERRADPSPRYNCHGLTFGARRTGIYEDEAVDQVLEDDGYVQINPDEHEVKPGDLLLYFTESGEVEHSAIVIEPPSDGRLGVPRVYGKWGNWAEVIHWANQCPYDFSNTKYYRVSL